MTTDAPTKDELLAAEIMAERELASILREAVERSGLDRQEIARRLGIHRSNVSRVLNSPQNLTIRMAARVLRAAGCRLSYATTPVVCGKSHTAALEARGATVLRKAVVTRTGVGGANRIAPDGRPEPLLDERRAFA